MAWSQLEIGKISGSVADASGARIGRAQVSLVNPLSGRQSHTRANVQGQFEFENVPYGSYLLRVSALGFESTETPVSVDSNVAAIIAVKMKVAGLQASIEVHSPVLLPDQNPRTETVIDESTIKLAPTVIRRDPLQALVSSTPGWSTENDGLMHIRGVDDGTLYVVGGIAMPGRIDGLFAGPLNTEAISSLDVITGNIPAEFGDRSGSVVVVQPKSGLDAPWSGMLSLGSGSFDSRELSATLARGNRTWGLFFAGAGHRSERFLDPVDPRNLNNIGGDLSLDLRFDWHASSRDLVRIGSLAQGTSSRVPNNELQQNAGQRRHQRLRHDQESVSWQHTWSPRTVSDIAYSHDFFSSKLMGSALDTPLTTNQDRHQRRQSIAASLSYARHGHTLKMGVQGSRVSVAESFGFAITDPSVAEESGISDAAMAFTPGSPFVFTGRTKRGTQAFYVQDDFSALPNLTLSAGLRYDHSDLLVSDQQFSPRLGAIYYLRRTKTALRASFDRLYMPPQTENLLIASSPQARALSPFAASGGGEDIRPEKLSSWEVGFVQELPRTLRLNIAYWWRDFRNIDDPNVLLNTTIIFPNSVARAEAKGLDARLDVPLRRGFSACFNYTNNQTVEIGPLNGGLFLDDDFIKIGPGTRFSPDHDQRNTGSMAVTYTSNKAGIWTSFSGRYESGVPLELPDLDSTALQSVPGASLVNFDTRRVRPWYIFGWSGGAEVLRKEHLRIAAQLDIQNLADRSFAFNWGNPFSGTHFGYPRLIAGRLKFSFK